MDQKDKEIAALKREIASMTADPTRYEILDVHEGVGEFLVLRVKFPSCTKCAFEGVKILVYPYVRPIDAMKWKRLDPHFRDGKPGTPQDAPESDRALPRNGRRVEGSDRLRTDESRDLSE